MCIYWLFVVSRVISWLISLLHRQLKLYNFFLFWCSEHLLTWYTLNFKFSSVYCNIIFLLDAHRQKFMVKCIVLIAGLSLNYLTVNQEHQLGIFNHFDKIFILWTHVNQKCPVIAKLHVHDIEWKTFIHKWETQLLQLSVLAKCPCVGIWNPRA